MWEKIKEIIKLHLLLIIVLIGIPSIAFWSLYFTANLPYITYAINSMAGMFTIVFLVWIEISKKLKGVLFPVIIGMASIFVTINIVYFGFNLISPVTLTITHLAEAGFSFLFGICVALSFRLIIYKKNKNDQRIMTDNLKHEIKIFIRIYGYYISLFFLTLGILFIILSEIARREVFGVNPQ